MQHNVCASLDGQYLNSSNAAINAVINRDVNSMLFDSGEDGNTAASALSKSDKIPSEKDYANQVSCFN